MGVLTILLLTALMGHAQGTVAWANSALAKVKYQVEPGGGIVDAPTGTKIGLFWGLDGTNWTMSVPTTAIGPTAGVFASGTVYGIPDTTPGQRVYLKMAGWDGSVGDEWGFSLHYGESVVVQVTLGPTPGPGAVIWQSASGTNPERMKPFTIVPRSVPQVIDFPELPEKVYGDPPFPLSATASSGLPVVYSSSDPSVAMIDGSSVIIVGAGTTLLTATQPGTVAPLPFLEPATTSRVLTVRQAAALVTLGGLTQTYNGSPQTPTVITVPAGLAVRWQFDGNVTPPLRAGTYSVVATVDARNYEGRATGVFTIAKAPQTIAFQELPRAVLGGELVPLVALASSGLPVVFSSSDPGIATVFGSSVVPAGPGTAVITARQEGDENRQPAPSVTWPLAVDCRLDRPATTGGSVQASPDLPAYPAGMEVQLIASPQPGFGFIRWTGDVSGSANPAILRLDTNKTVSAVFASVAMTVLVEGSGTVNKEPDQPYYALGDTVVLRPQPARWHRFSHWTDGVLDSPRSVVVGESNRYGAVFVPAVTLETFEWGGVVREGPVGMPAVLVDGVFETNLSVTVRGSAQVSLGSSFPRAILLYTLDGTPPGLASRLYVGPVTVNRSATVRAVAYPVDFSQAVQSDPLRVEVLPRLTAGSDGGGRVTVDPPAGAYRADGRAGLMAEADPGWTFLMWEGDVLGEMPTASVLMDRPRCASAVFGTTFDVSAVGGGTVAGPGPEAGAFYPFGDVVILTAVPQAGQYFAFWANAVSATNNPLSLAIVSPQPVVTAVFAPLPAGSQALTVISEGCGAVAMFPRANRHAAGTMVRLTAEPQPGQQFLGWSGDVTGTANPVMVPLSQSRVITARFTQRPSVWIVECGGAANPDAMKVMVKGRRAGRYGIETSPGLSPFAWASRGILETPYGRAQYLEPISKDWSQRVYRAVDVTDP